VADVLDLLQVQMVELEVAAKWAASQNDQGAAAKCCVLLLVTFQRDQVLPGDSTPHTTYNSTSNANTDREHCGTVDSEYVSFYFG